MLCYFLVRYIRIDVDSPAHFVEFYLTDLLFVPAMSLFALIFVRLLKRDATIKISPLLIFIQVVLVSLYFEVYLPKITTYVSDPVDVLMYVLGGFIFLLIQPTTVLKKH
ncbi:MAG: hypothetical protein ACJA1C_002922 [Crocinitomicaceae bacterium]|jgi:hypothetical protein